MSGDELLQLLTQTLFVVIFIVAAVRAVRRPYRANINIALLFGASAISITITWVTRVLGVTAPPLVAAIATSLIAALPYLLLRLLDDFSHVPRLLMRAAEAGLVVIALSLFIIQAPRPVWWTLLVAIYFVTLTTYTSIKFVVAARQSGGVTQRRLQTVAFGSFFLGLTIAIAGFQAVLPNLMPLWTVLMRIFGLAAGLGYFLGFAPPAWLRRAWQEPELRAFLGRAARLPRLPNTEAIVRELEHGSATSVGAPAASIGLWDEDAGVLRFRQAATGEPFDVQPGQFIAGQAFARQQAVFAPNAARADPANAEIYHARGAVAVLAAPITAGHRRLGVLTVYAPRAPIFADDDLVLVQLLADQAAVILESRALIDEAARIQAREEATRLKEDFLSSAAHDLKTPLTTLVALAQLMERRQQRTPQAPADLATIQRLKDETERLRRLVLELLDASRAEQGQLVGPRLPTDLTALAQESCARHTAARYPCAVEAPGPVIGAFDPVRLLQLLDNLIENAVKYSPDGGEVRVRIWQEGETAHLSVTDQGIGIPASDLPHIFDRFHRGTNVDDRRFSGMGLGLFICQAIVEQHSGTIHASSPGLGHGTTIHITLPLTQPATIEPVEPSLAEGVTNG